MSDFKFKLPVITKLTSHQSLAYNPTESMLITGGPGCGKNVVTIFRFLRPVRERKEVMLFTFNRTLMASIRGTLKEKAEELFGELDEKTVETVIANNVASFYKCIIIK